jgi:hypothetical protein
LKESKGQETERAKEIEKERKRKREKRKKEREKRKKKKDLRFDKDRCIWHMSLSTSTEKQNPELHQHVDPHPSTRGTFRQSRIAKQEGMMRLLVRLLQCECRVPGRMLSPSF